MFYFPFLLFITLDLHLRSYDGKGRGFLKCRTQINISFLFNLGKIVPADGGGFREEIDGNQTDRNLGVIAAISHLFPLLSPVYLTYLCEVVG